MIKNLLWKQALELAKKKFGNLNTNEANKWLMDKYNALLGKENTKNIANKIREDLKRDRPFDNWKPEVIEHDPFKNLRGNESFDELIELGGKKIKKFDPFKKEGKKIDFGKYYDKRKRGEFDEGGPVYSAEDINRRLKTLKKVRQGLAPSSYLYLRDELVKDALASGLISEEDYFNKWQKPFFGERGEKWTDAIDAYEQRNFNEGGLAGMLGETQQVGYATDRTKIVKELYDAAGGFDGTGKSFEEFMADVLFEGDYLAKGGRVGLKDGGMTPSEKWMRNYYFDGKGGYDTWMSFQEFMTGPGIDLWNRHIGKAEGGIIGLKEGGSLLEKYKKVAPKGPWTRGLTDMEITFELYNLLEPYMSLFMKEGGRVGFKEGKGMSRRAFLKLMGAAAALPVVGKFFKLAKPASKVMDDIKITLRGDGDWEQDIDGYWSGGNWVNYSFEALTDKGRKILNKLTKGKNASLVDQGDGVYFPGKVVKSKSHVGGQYLTDEADHAVDAVDAIKKSKGNISLNTRVGKNTKGIDKSQKKYPGESTDSTEYFKTYSSKNINKQNILDEADDMWVGDYGGYRNKGFYDESVEDIIDIITKKAEGGRVGLYKGGIIDLLIKGGKFLNKNSPVELYKKYLKSVKDRTLKANKTGKFTDLPLEVIPIASAGALVTNYLKKKLKSLDEKPEEKAEGGRIGLDTGGPPIEPYSTSDPKAAAKEMARRYIDRTVEPAKVPIDKDIQLMFDLDRAKIGGTKDFLGGEIDFGINKGFGRDDMGYGFNWSKKFSDGGSVLQRPMFYQGGLTKTVPPERGPMPQGLQSDVYDGIMRLGVINGRN